MTVVSRVIFFLSLNRISNATAFLHGNPWYKNQNRGRREKVRRIGLQKGLPVEPYQGLYGTFFGCLRMAPATKTPGNPSPMMIHAPTDHVTYLEEFKFLIRGSVTHQRSRLLISGPVYFTERSRLPVTLGLGFRAVLWSTRATPSSDTHQRSRLLVRVVPPTNEQNFQITLIKFLLSGI